MITASSASAAIQACRQSDGSIVFQDSACAVVQPEKKVRKNVAESIPFGIEKTWFDNPEVLPDRPQCTKDGCHCGMYSRKFDSGLPLAIADALYLDGSWHRLDNKLMQLDLAVDNASQHAELLKEVDEAACDILMAQKTLRMFGQDTLRELRNKKRYAEDRGLDDPADCDAGDDMVCTYTELIGLYDRIQSDIRSLRSISRVSDDSSELLNANVRVED